MLLRRIRRRELTHFELAHCGSHHRHSKIIDGVRLWNFWVPAGDRVHPRSIRGFLLALGQEALR
jgi:hypothetical protein